ncbi:hypothetical protein KPL71_014473 [Citrus sinensis]|uniref:Uncharacterized protein n=1 Tax=Citrus sinensis TaxID=2711 RepID=A0ACB8KBU9_CITSI|nr:hypothetical protein KPL71_014473 [Citrus sinensis]
MRIYLQALDYKIWEIVNDGPFMPLTKNEVEEDIPKPSREWNEFEKRKASLNSKAMNALFCALDKKEFHRVSSCESANEIWHKLEVVYEGTNQVKESKISRFTDIVNTLGAVGKTFSNSEKVKKIIRSLPKEWRPKRTAIEEAKDLNVLPIVDLISSLISYEEDLAVEKGHEEKKKNIALKASKRESDDESEMDDEELAMLARRFRKFYKKNNEQRKFRGYKNKKEKKEPITCYECKKPGNIRLECPFLNKLKKKAMVATCDDSDEETSDDDEQQEMTNLALMTIGEESCDELDEVSVLPTYDELHDAFKDLHDELMKIAFETSLASVQSLRLPLQVAMACEGPKFPHPADYPFHNDHGEAGEDNNDDIAKLVEQPPPESPAPAIKPELRRPFRERRPSTRYPPHKYVMLTDEEEQECFEEAISHKDESERVKTMQEEIKSLNEKHNYELVNTRLVVKDFN